jgi:hypothetical protein
MIRLTGVTGQAAMNMAKKVFLDSLMHEEQEFWKLMGKTTSMSQPWVWDFGVGLLNDRISVVL